jgi:hypothetical protein
VRLRCLVLVLGVLSLVACRRAAFDPTIKDPPASDDDASQVGDGDGDGDAPKPGDDAGKPPIDEPPADRDAETSRPDADTQEPGLDASSCADVERDVMNCGSCGRVCPGAGLDEASCAWGECKVSGCTLGESGGHTYAFCTAPKTWTAARAYCRELSLDLVDIGDAEERAFVESLVVGSLVWIGLHDRTSEGDYYFVAPSGDEAGRKVWTGGHAEGTAYVPWASSQPDSFGDEDCVRFDPGAIGGYQDLGCELIWGFVCEST